MMKCRGSSPVRRKVIRVRQSVDAATRTVCGVNSKASSADLGMPTELEARLRVHLRRHDALKILRGGFHSMRHGAASSLIADGATPAVVQRQLRHSDARITLGIYGHVGGDEPRSADQYRTRANC
jgi:integrase